LKSYLPTLKLRMTSKVLLMENQKNCHEAMFTKESAISIIFWALDWLIRYHDPFKNPVVRSGVQGPKQASPISHI